MILLQTNLSKGGSAMNIKLNEHLIFDDMVDFVYSTELTDEAIKLAQRVNSHIFTCKECREVYESLLAIKEATDERILENIQVAEAQDKVGLLDKFVAAITISIKEKSQILIDAVNNYKPDHAFDFGYPVALATRGEGNLNNQVKNVIIDDDNEFNQISYENGCLIIQLDAEDWNIHAPEVMLLDNEGKVIASGTMAISGGSYSKRFIIDDIDHISIYIG